MLPFCFVFSLSLSPSHQHLHIPGLILSTRLNDNEVLVARSCHTPLSVEFFRQEEFPSPGDLPDSGIEPGSPVLQADSLLSNPSASTHICTSVLVYVLQNLNTNNEFELNHLMTLYPIIISALFDLKQKRESK